MKILNLYCGLGGNRKLWGNDHEITAIEYDQETANVYKNYFPNDIVIVTDAHKYLLDHFKEFDFIWSSPPCPTHSDVRRCRVDSGHTKAKYPSMKLYQEIILLKHFAGTTKFVIENVIPYYEPLIPPTKKLHRHLYWSNFQIGNFIVSDDRKHDNIIGSSGLYGFDIENTKIKDKRKALRNMVDPELGLHILEQAQGIIRKQNTKQIELSL